MGALRRPDSPGVCDTWEACDRRPGKVPGRRVLCAPRGARGRAAQKRGHRLVETFKPKLGLSRKVEGVAGAQTGNTVCASLLQRPDPELGMRVYSLALAARTRAHEAPTSSQRYNTHALLAAVPSATTPIALMLALVSASDAGGTKACSPGATRFVYVLFHLRHFLGPSPRHLIWSPLIPLGPHWA